MAGTKTNEKAAQIIQSPILDNSFLYFSEEGKFCLKKYTLVNAIDVIARSGKIYLRFQPRDVLPCLSTMVNFEKSYCISSSGHRLFLGYLPLSFITRPDVNANDITFFFSETFAPREYKFG